MSTKMYPFVCTKEEEKGVEFLTKCIEVREPAALVGMKDVGKNTVYEEVLKKNKKSITNFLHATTEEELKLFLSTLTSLETNIVCVVNLSIGKDVSWFIEELEKMRQKKGTKFVSIVISHVQEIFSSVKNNQKILMRSLFVMKPFSEEDTSRLIGYFEERFGYKLTKKQKEFVKFVTGGQAGMIKSSYLLFKYNPQKEINLSILLKESAIVSRLKGITDELPAKVINHHFLFPKNTWERDFLEKWGYLRDGKIFSPLLEGYLKKHFTTSSDVQTFTDAELIVFTYFKEHAEEIVAREKVAEVLWKEKWDDKYSDWAIDQVIHRIRVKIDKSKLPYILLTKKGKGFILLVRIVSG